MIPKIGTPGACAVIILNFEQADFTAKDYLQNVC